MLSEVAAVAAGTPPRDVIVIALGLGAAVGGVVGYQVGNLVGAYRAARSSWRTVRGKR